MHFYEFEAKRVLAKHGIPDPAERIGARRPRRSSARRPRSAFPSF